MVFVKKVDFLLKTPMPLYCHSILILTFVSILLRHDHASFRPVKFLFDLE